MPTTLSLKAPCKVNLYLKVLRRRRDGFHELDTLFERINLCDEIVLKPYAKGIRLKCNVKSLPTGPKNLVYKAALLLKSKFAVKKGVQILLKKKTPIAAGLGGGSSDAATTLMGLNRFWNLKLSTRQLMDLASYLGSDVPFFILDTPYAIGRGRGEKLHKVCSRLKIWHVLVKPRIKVLTKHVYQGLKPHLLTRSRANARMLAAVIQKKNILKLNQMLFNALEDVVVQKYAVIRTIKRDLLKAGASTALVSGSGPTVFGLAKSRHEAVSIKQKMLKKHPKKFVAIAHTL